jgi:hypothetical protein
MGPQSSGYSWASTSQWSQLPTVPADQSNQTAQQSYNASSAPTNTYSSQPNYSANQQNYGYTPTNAAPPETRRDMITRLYRRILGREPDAAGLNYYLFNTQIPELQIAREMYESTEHQDNLKKARDVRDMVKKLAENDARLKEIEVKLQNADSLAKNYKLLVDQKTQIINELRAQTGDYSSEQINVAPQTQAELQHTVPPHIQPYDQYEEGILLNDPFAEDYEQRGKGCMGTIRKWLRF